MKTVCLLASSGFFCLLLSLTGCATDRGPLYVKDGHRYGFTGNIWRDRWWNYYERGLSYADGGYWPDAIADFQAAMRQRSDDQRRARTTGLDAIDYFPHRELGIIYYHLERYEDAIGALQTSIAATESSKAKFYLNAARKVLVEQTNRDVAAPRIRLAEALDGTVTNQLTLILRGQVEDDTYVSALAIHGQRHFIELAEPSIDFTQEISLHEGLNTVDIVAADLLGHVARQQIRVDVDRQGPLVSFRQVEMAGDRHQRLVRVQGALTDRSDIARLRIGVQSIPLTSLTEGQFRVDVPMAASTTSVPFEAEDAVGNVTRDEMRLHPVTKRQASRAVRPAPARLALFRPGTLAGELVSLRSFWRRDHNPPVIKPKFVSLSGRRGTANESYLKLYDKAIFLEGSVTDAGLIETFSIDGEPLKISPGSQIFFAKHVPLQEGHNEFLLQAVDQAGNTASHKIVVNRIVQSIQALDSRLRVLLLPFAKQGQAASLTEFAYEHLYNAFVKQGRFSIPDISQLPPDLQSDHLATSARIDVKYVAKIGSALGADSMLIGVLKESVSSLDHAHRALEVHVRFVDVTTSTVLAAEDIFHGNITPDIVQTLMEGLAWKIQRHFPLIKGLVIQVEGDRIFIDLGNNHAIKQGMKLTFFREGKPIKHPRTGANLGAPTEILGEARIESIFDNFSQVTLLSATQDKLIQQLDQVMTK